MNKMSNKIIKIINGNRRKSKALNIVHWNIGSTKWINKIMEN